MSCGFGANGSAALSRYHSEPSCGALRGDACWLNAEHVKPRGLFVEEAIAAALESRWSRRGRRQRSAHRTPRRRRGDVQPPRQGEEASSVSSAKALVAYRSSLELNPLNLDRPEAGTSHRARCSKRAPVLLPRRGHRRRPVQRGAGQERAHHPERRPEAGRRRGLHRPRGHGRADRLGDPAHRGDVARGRARGGGVEIEPSAASAHGDRQPLLGRRGPCGGEKIELIIREIFQAPENSRKSSFPVSRDSPPGRVPALCQGLPALRTRGRRRGVR